MALRDAASFAGSRRRRSVVLIGASATCLRIRMMDKFARIDRTSFSLAMDKVARYFSDVKLFRTVAALVLLACWAPISSHELLEHWGVIHVQASNASENHSDDHDAADGICRLPAGPFQLQNFLPSQITLAMLPAVVVDAAAESIWQQASFALVNPSPPDIPVGWQFSFRAALPVRAPSFIS